MLAGSEVAPLGTSLDNVALLSAAFASHLGSAD
jgi:hypothetical protein